MKQYDFVRLAKINDKYTSYNLYQNANGIVWEILNDSYAKVLFFNEYNEGEYAYLDVNVNDLEIIKRENLELRDFIQKNSHKFSPHEKGFSPKLFEAYQNAELLIEDPKLVKLGIHKGDIGTIMEDFCVKNEVLVDFGRLDENNIFSGDCVSINLKYLKLLDKH